MFSNADVSVATAVLQWAREYLCTPNEKMRRTRNGSAEAVCPFVKASLESNHFYIEIRRDINGESPDPIAEAMCKYGETLRTVPPCNPTEQQRKSPIVMCTELT